MPTLQKNDFLIESGCIKHCFELWVIPDGKYILKFATTAKTCSLVWNAALKYYKLYLERPKLKLLTPKEMHQLCCKDLAQSISSERLSKIPKIILLDVILSMKKKVAMAFKTGYASQLPKPCMDLFKSFVVKTGLVYDTECSILIIPKFGTIRYKTRDTIQGVPYEAHIYFEKKQWKILLVTITRVTCTRTSYRSMKRLSQQNYIQYKNYLTSNRGEVLDASS